MHSERFLSPTPFRASRSASSHLNQRLVAGKLGRLLLKSISISDLVDALINQSQTPVAFAYKLRCTVPVQARTDCPQMEALSAGSIINFCFQGVYKNKQADYKLAPIPYHTNL